MKQEGQANGLQLHVGAKQRVTGAIETTMADDPKNKLAELRRLEGLLRTSQQKLATAQRKLKQDPLAGATIEAGDLYAELRLLPGRNPSSKDPDDYDLVVSYVS